MPVLTPSWKLRYVRTYLLVKRANFVLVFAEITASCFSSPKYLPFLKHLRKNFEFKCFWSQLPPFGASKTLGAKNCYATFCILFWNLFLCYKIWGGDLPNFVDRFLLYLSFCPLNFLGENFTLSNAEVLFETWCILLRI